MLIFKLEFKYSTVRRREKRGKRERSRGVGTG
jgi:hypothetical protein